LNSLHLDLFGECDGILQSCAQADGLLPDITQKVYDKPPYALGPMFEYVYTIGSYGLPFFFLSFFFSD